MLQKSTGRHKRDSRSLNDTEITNTGDTHLLPYLLSHHANRVENRTIKEQTVSSEKQPARNIPKLVISRPYIGLRDPNQAEIYERIRLNMCLTMNRENCMSWMTSSDWSFIKF
ncbi:hypothetical protein ElyMa_004667100 [Elysia marginata]|uniref:Uncharacterized protein n=1 Tax=Elysia marginata TaxID=1093978 RepID=A0AAV4I4G7_9GAST|nr:hypothetical protein ElyMa_004667100 [Elysia marginata]